MKDLSNVPGIDNTDPNYVNGKIVELVTLVKEDIHQDIIQLHQKLMDLASIVANDNQDNEANGYQLLQALISLINSEAYTKTEANDRFLDEANNLSDLDNAATARSNLDVYSTSQTDALISNNVKLGGGVIADGSEDGGITDIGSWSSAKISTGIYEITHSLNTQDLIVMATSKTTDLIVSADAFNKTNTTFRIKMTDENNVQFDGRFNFIALQ
jgi:hypothetical protein